MCFAWAAVFIPVWEAMGHWSVYIRWIMIRYRAKIAREIELEQEGLEGLEQDEANKAL